MKNTLTCVECGRTYSVTSGKVKCACGGQLVPILPDSLKRVNSPGIWSWKAALVTSVFRDRVTLFEGNTPLVRAPRLAEELSLKEVYLKDESRNPSGTFIDRGSATLVTAAKSLRLVRLVAASLGDLGVSVATYSRRARLRCKVIMPSYITPVKAYQTAMLANSVEYVESYEESLSKAWKYGSALASMPVTPQNPFLLDGYRTLAMEILKDLRSRKPGVVLVPVGDGALAYATLQIISKFSPNTAVIGVRTSSQSPLLKDVAVDRPLFADLLKELMERNEGYMVEVGEDDVVSALKLLAKYEGMLTELPGATAVAALIKLSKDLRGMSPIVSVISGGPARDPAVLRMVVSESHPKYLAKIGFTKMKILEVLALQGPLHPYAVWKILRSEYGVNVSLRSIYQHFSELSEMRLVEGAEEREGRRRRKMFRVTDEGLSLIR